MIKNFEAVKQQLLELADVVNAYKSEAVQLRVVELAFTASTGVAREDPQSRTEPGPPARRPPTRGRTGDTPEGSSTSRANRKLGGKALLSRLHGEGFFQGRAQTLGSIVSHADTNLATKVKQSDLSGPLAQYVRNGKLKRSKNAEDQYEYIET